MEKQVIHTNLKPLTITLVLLVACLLFCLPSEAKLFRPNYPYDDPYDQPFGASGQRAIVRVSGARDTYDGRAPSRLILEDSPWGSGYAPSRGIYDRNDYGRGRMPYYPGDYGLPSYHRG